LMFYVNSGNNKSHLAPDDERYSGASVPHWSVCHSNKWFCARISIVDAQLLIQNEKCWAQSWIWVVAERSFGREPLRSIGGSTVKPRIPFITQMVVTTITLIAVLFESPRNGRTNNRNVISMRAGIHLTMKLSIGGKTGILGSDLRDEDRLETCDTAGGRTWIDYFVLHLQCPIIIHGNTVLFLFVAEVRTRQCYRYLQKISTCRSIDGSNNHYADQLSGKRLIEAHGYPNTLFISFFLWNKWILKHILRYHLIFAQNCGHNSWFWLWHERCTLSCTSECHPRTQYGRFIWDASQWTLLLDIDPVFRSGCNKFMTSRDCKLLNQFKWRFSRFSASIMQKRGVARPIGKSTENLFISNISEDDSLAPSSGSVSRETGNVPASCSYKSQGTR
jgi:hypothetical protein